jgi:hypothetical protein
MMIPDLKIIYVAEELSCTTSTETTNFQMWNDVDGSLSACASATEGGYWLRFPDFASFWFTGADSVVTAYAIPAIHEERIKDCYYRSALPLILQAHSLEVLHASAVLMSHGVIGFCARSKTGKSTLAYGIGQRGYPLWADDALAFELTDLEVTALPLPFAVHLRPSSSAHFGLNPSAEGRHDIQKPNAGPTALAAIFVLERFADLEPESAVAVVRLTSASALTALLPHAYFFDLLGVQHRQHTLRHYLDLVSRVPVFRLQFASGLHYFEQLADAVIETISNI